MTSKNILNNCILGLSGLILIVGLVTPSLAASHASSTYEGEFTAACVANSNIPEPICACIAETAMAEDIDDTQREWILLATTGSDEAEALAKTLTPAQATGATMFLVSTPQQCASQLAN